MSEQAPAKANHDLPAIETPHDRINIRKALAGVYLLNGEGSMTRCLMRAGYSRASARIQTKAGLTAKSCLEEAAKMDVQSSPGKLLEAGRRRAALAIAACDPAKVPLKDSMKMLETVEKFYGGHELAANVALTTVADRLSSIAALLAVARQRGLPVPALPDYQEAEIVASSSEPEVTSTAAKLENLENPS